MSKVILVLAIIFSFSAQAEEVYVFGEKWMVVTESDELVQCLANDVCRTARLDSFNTYIAKPGDTQFGVAKSRGLTVKELRFANPSLRGDSLLVGQRLNIPGID